MLRGWMRDGVGGRDRPSYFFASLISRLFKPCKVSINGVASLDLWGLRAKPGKIFSSRVGIPCEVPNLIMKIQKFKNPRVSGFGSNYGILKFLRNVPNPNPKPYIDTTFTLIRVSF